MARMDRYRYRPEFIAAWLFLVVMVAVGFWVQAGTIDRAREADQAIASHVDEVQAQQTENVLAVCDLFLRTADDRNERLQVRAAFLQMGYTCPGGGE